MVRRMMVPVFVLALLSATGAPAGERANPGLFKFDSARQLALDLVISDGYLLTVQPQTRDMATTYVRQQLNYLVGQLNHFDSLIQLTSLQITINETETLHDGSGLLKTHYAAKGLVAWNRDLAIPAPFEAILPARAGLTRMTAFFEQYKNGCAEESGESTVDNFWYHFRPLYPSCALAAPTPAEKNVVARIPVQLQASARNTSGKFPEYGKVWEDGKLVVTVVVGKYTPGAVADEDAGISTYNDLYQGLLLRYGAPVTSNVRLTGNPGAAHPDLELTYKLRSGPLDLHIYLVDKLADATPAFVAKYNARTLISDLVIYNGHAGLGANVRAISRLGKFAPGKYQLFVVNGCDSFAYADDSLFKAHAAVNPGSAPTKYLDLITNAMPAYFTSMDDVALATIAALDGQQLSYRELLDQFDDSQRALVTGEEDNAWPRAF